MNDINMESLEEIKLRISNETGVPVALLDGENEEENRSRALALLAFKKEHSGYDPDKYKEPKSTSEQFGEMFNNYMESKEFIKIQSVPDASDNEQPEKKSTKEQFGEWFRAVMGGDNIY